MLWSYAQGGNPITLLSQIKIAFKYNFRNSAYGFVNQDNVFLNRA